MDYPNQITFSVDDKMKEALERAKEKEKKSLSKTIRKLIEVGLKKELRS